LEQGRRLLRQSARIVRGVSLAQTASSVRWEGSNGVSGRTDQKSYSQIAQRDVFGLFHYPQTLPRASQYPFHVTPQWLERHRPVLHKHKRAHFMPKKSGPIPAATTGGAYLGMRELFPGQLRRLCEGRDGLL
jgi:hypothetical protein